MSRTDRLREHVPGRVPSIPLPRSVAAVRQPAWPDIRDVAVMWLLSALASRAAP
jgi:hypothetical protein